MFNDWLMINCPTKYWAKDFPWISMFTIVEEGYSILKQYFVFSLYTDTIIHQKKPDINQENIMVRGAEMRQKSRNSKSYMTGVQVYMEGNHVIWLLWSLTYPDTCLGTNPHSSTESDSLIQTPPFPDWLSG